ncbi:glycosyltransferase family 4 protein [Thiorhodococcus minor]|uniref:Glycosyltransferase family 4 protein n=1 Tax=Thiorhodococcus minor TaxID=57489 RepID=A0A6M0K716_9GAMM|nr:glycosyltransferase family 4 protein [Thiorhodococcus minor]NEV65054.1 glycosyltransferase family 4 protein [Thiorhodococcus minor]
MNLSQALVARGDVDLHLVTVSPWVTHSQTVEVEGMTIHIVKGGVPTLHRGWPRFLPLDAATGFRMEARAVRFELRQIKPDLIHAHGTEKGYALTAMHSGYPYLVSIQGIIAEYYKMDPCLYYRLMRPREANVIRRTKNFTCRTHFDTSYVRRLNPSAKIFNICEAMSPVFWEGQWESKGGYRILFVGSGAPRKGFDDLIAAAAVISEKFHAVSIDAVGIFSGKRRETLARTADKARIAIRFHGFQTAPAISELHRQCDLFVLCSSIENSPNTLAEAMVSGMPCVSYDVGGVSSMIDAGRTGLLVAPGDITGLAAAAMELMGDRRKAQHLGAAAASAARSRHRPEHVAAATWDAYRDILAASGKDFA